MAFAQVIDISAALILDRDCTTDGLSWSVISSSSSTSNLAAILAGLMVTAIAVMFVERSGETPRHTLGLFASGVVVLGLDSYLFSSISGRRPPMTDSHLTMLDARVDISGGGLAVCRAVWAQAMPAYGMLAAGSVALVGGISWMLTHYATKSSGQQPNWFLPFLGGLLTFIVTTGTTALVAQISVDYVNVMRLTRESHGLPAAPTWFLWVMGVLVLGVMVLALAVVFVRTAGMLGVVLGMPQDGDVPAEARLRLIPLAAVLTALLALLGPTFAGLLVQRGVDDQSPFVVGTAFTLGVVVPVTISLCICYSVPGYGLAECGDALRRSARWRPRR
jgi:hypothetical protein